MLIQPTRKIGVLGVLGVPESLKASNDTAYSDGTRTVTGVNTWCSEHETCSGELAASITEHTTAGGRHFAEGHGIELPHLKGANRAQATERWVLLPDTEGRGRLLWAWNPLAPDDLDALFARIGVGESTDEDNELFKACMLDRFIQRVHDGKDIERWILMALADAFWKVLMGGDWCDEIILPGRPTNPVRPPREERDLEIYCAVCNCIKREGTAVTEAIARAGDAYAVSYETARAAYYKWKDRLSKNTTKTQKDQ